MGAAVAVLDEDPHTPSPVAFLAAKSWHGHAEPAAGVLGLAHAHMALSHQATLPMLHLRSLNPHIRDTFSSRNADLRPVGAARQLAALPHMQTSQDRQHALFCGISAFAFQGTNAHAIMSVQSGPVTADQPSVVSLPFQRQRYWVAPMTHPLLATFSNSKRQLAVLEAHLGTPAAAYLWDHVVSERALMPGAGSFDLACTAARLLSHPSVTASAVVSNISLPAPLLLPQRRADAAAMSVHVRLDLLTGKLSIVSTEAQQTHLTGTVSWSAQQTSAKWASTASPDRDSPALAWLHTTPQTHSRQLGSAIGVLAEAHPTPAQLDCAFHLGAILSQQTDEAFTPLRVPVGAQAVMLGTSTNSSDAQLNAVAQVQPPDSEGSLITDISVPGLGTVQHMLAKPLNSSKAQNLSGTGEASMLYIMARPASEPAMQSEAALASSGYRTSLNGKSLFAIYAQALAVAKNAASGSLGGNGQSALVLQTAGALASALTAQPCNSAAHTSQLLGLRALVKTLGHENPLLPCHAVDLHAAQPSLTASSRPILSILPSNRTTAQQAKRGSAQQAGVTHTSKLLPMTAAEGPALQGPFQLMPVPRGSLDSLKQIRLPKLAPAAGQVLLEVHAVGVNFRDVLNVLGMYPGDPGAPGADCAGIIVAVGPGITGLSAGTC